MSRSPIEKARHQKSETAAWRASSLILSRLGLAGVKTALILGTGWGDTLKLEGEEELPFGDIPGFDDLDKLEGHARCVVAGKLAGEIPVVMLKGRVHLNESPAGESLPKMVRLQTEMLCQLGIKNLIVTCGAGSLDPAVKPGDIAVIDGFFSLGGTPPMPLYAGEFCSPEDTLSGELMYKAFVVCQELGIPGIKGGYAMVRGPQFEGRKYDKPFLVRTGAKLVGMSTLPEACVAALYPEVRVLALAFVTNGMAEEHSHESNIAAAKASKESLGDFLTRTVIGITG